MWPSVCNIENNDGTISSIGIKNPFPGMQIPVYLEGRSGTKYRMQVINNPDSTGCRVWWGKECPFSDSSNYQANFEEQEVDTADFLIALFNYKIKLLQ